jgi:hypothetical protein
MHGRHVILGLLASLPLVGGAAMAAERMRADALPVTRIQDLHYGDVLFNLYIGDDFEALTRLEAYSRWQLLTHHTTEAGLLAGGLYLQLGMHNEAGRRFEALLGPTVPAAVRNKAWFYLGRVWYARGYFDKTVEALNKIAGPLPGGLDSEREQLLSNALMRLGRYDEAVRSLESVKASGDWTVYSQFNLGVALVRSNRLAEADRQLTAVGTLSSDREELLALRDKANLALGFAYLQAERPADAKLPLERVRLKGAQSNKALLGLGWADAALGQFEQALTPWLELRDRNLLDAAVQEANLAVPYAFGKLGASGQAAEYYEQALKAFADESTRIDTSIRKIRDGELLAELLKDDEETGSKRGWLWQLKQLPDAPESRYLYPILAGNEFQEGLKNIRDLAYLGSTLGRWDENMVVYTDMIEARERAYAERTPRVDTMLDSNLVANFDDRRQSIEARVNDIIARQDEAALGTATERAQWQLVGELEAAISADPNNPDAVQLKDKLRLAKGVLSWNLQQTYRARLYAQRRELRQLDQALAEAHNRWLRVQRARATAPTTTGDFATRLAALQGRLTTLRASLTRASALQGDLLADMAIVELKAQQQRMAEYEVQARFELASMYDRAAVGAKK